MSIHFDRHAPDTQVTVTDNLQTPPPTQTHNIVPQEISPDSTLSSKPRPKPSKLKIASRIILPTISGAAISTGIAGLLTLIPGGLAIHSLGFLLAAVAGAIPGLVGGGLWAKRLPPEQTTPTTPIQRPLTREDDAAIKIQRMTRGFLQRKKTITPAMIRKTNQEAWKKAGMTPKEITETSRAIAYEHVGVGVQTRADPTVEYRRGNAPYRDPDSLSKNKLWQKIRRWFGVYRTTKNPKPFWANPQEKRYTVRGAYLASGGFKDIHGGVEVTLGQAKKPVDVKPAAIAIAKGAKLNGLLVEAQQKLAEIFTPEEMEEYGLARTLRDIDRLDPAGRMEATDMRYQNSIDKLKDKMTIEQKIVLLQRIAYAISGFHKKGWVHCDLKPENILIDDDNMAYLADFDLITPVNDPTAKGTAGYTDTLSGNRRATPFQDIYALAMTAVKVLGREGLSKNPQLADAISAVHEANDAIAAAIREGKKPLEDFTQLSKQYPAFEAFRDMLVEQYLASKNPPT